MLLDKIKNYRKTTINNRSKLLKLVNSWSNFCIEFILKYPFKNLSMLGRFESH